MTCLFSFAVSESKLNSEDHPLPRAAVTVAELLKYILKNILKAEEEWFLGTKFLKPIDI